MGRQCVTVELDDEVLKQLAVLGAPVEALEYLATSVAASVQHPTHAQRKQTDDSLLQERNEADSRVSQQRAAVEARADAVIQLARTRADEVVQAAEDRAEREVEAPCTDRVAEAMQTSRSALEVERSAADAVVAHERAQQRDVLETDRDTTDQHLSGERTQFDTALSDLRQANEQLVSTTLRAQELADEAAAAQAEAEEGRRKLEEVAELRELFIGILGHDLRAPLGAVTLAADLLLRRNHLDSQDQRVVTRMKRSSERMTRMVSQLLDLTRARLGAGLSLELKPCDLRELCETAAEEFDAPIELALEGDLTGTWDCDRLAEVLGNLTSNAIAFATPGSPVRIAARPDDGYAEVEVINQGEPIPPEVLPFIFEPFRRAKQREKSSAGNLGLGLYIAKEIVAAHGGTIEGRSVDGTTTFTIRLPRSRPV